MKNRTPQFRKVLIEECIQEGWKVLSGLDEEFRKLRAKLGEGSGEEVSSMLEAPTDEAMDEWLEKTVKKLNPIIGSRKWPDIFGKNCTSIEDYIDRLYLFESELGEQVGEGEEKLILIDTLNSKVTNLKNDQAIELAGTDYWKYLKILVEADGEKVGYEDIVGRLAHKKHMGTKSKICGDLKKNLLTKLLETGLPLEDLEKIITTKNSHQLNQKYVSVR